MTDDIKNTKVNPLTVGIIAFMILIGIEIGMLIKGQEFAIEEVNGVRSDMDKEDAELLQRIILLEERQYEEKEGK